MKKRSCAWGKWVERGELGILISLACVQSAPTPATSCPHLCEAAGLTPGYSLCCLAVGQCRGWAAGRGQQETPVSPFAPAAAAGQDGRVPADQEALALSPRAVQAHAAAQALCQPALPAGWLQREEPQHGGCANLVGMKVPGPLLCRPPCPACHRHSPQCSQQADPAWATRVPLPHAFPPPGQEKSPRLCWVNVSGQVALASTSELGLPVTVTTLGCSPCSDPPAAAVTEALSTAPEPR